MKLYTEQEIKRTFGFGMSQTMFDGFFNAMKPIELPSDEEIDTFINAPRYYKMCPTEYREGIEEGAKWMRDKIQGGNK